MGNLCSSSNATADGAGKAKVFGLAMSQNTMGPVLLAMDCKAGGLEVCDLMAGAHKTEEFLAMNPFHHVPTLKDGDVELGESSAILRYLATKYKKEYYPAKDAPMCAWIDFAIDSFSNEVYPEHKKTCYVTAGFAEAAEDQGAANAKYVEVVNTWMGHFLKGKFVCGDKLTIADFKAVPFLTFAVQPAMEATIGLKMPDRARQYVDDFCAAVKASESMKSDGGSSLVEFAASKAPQAEAPGAYDKAKHEKYQAKKPSGEVKILGLPVSQTTMSCVLLAMDCGKGGLEQCNIMEGAQMTPEFLAMNPFHHIPTLKDGGVEIGESSAILRYLALKYKPEYYPVSDPAKCARIDFAIESFNEEVYRLGHYNTCYVVMGFNSAPKDQGAATKLHLELIDTWAGHFLKEKFVCGDKVTIADFKAVPFLFAAAQPVMEKKIGLKVPERVARYLEDFSAAVAASAMLSEAGGWSIKEFCATKE